MEGGFLLFGERGPLALEAGSQPVQVEVIAAVVERGCFTVDIAPIGTDLGFLVESRTIGAKESEVLHLSCDAVPVCARPRAFFFLIFKQLIAAGVRTRREVSLGEKRRKRD